MNNNTPLWHYTKLNLLPSILKDGVIKLATVGVPANQKPAAWFSLRQIWEPTATIRLRDRATDRVWYARDIEEMAKYTTPVRIEVDPSKVRLLTWRDFKANSGITRELAKGLAKTAREWGADPDFWRASFHPVSSNAWLRIQVYEGGQWVDRTIAELECGCAAQLNPMEKKP